MVTKRKITLTPDQQRRLVLDISRHGGPVWAQQFKQWVDRGVYYAKETAGGIAAPASLAIFWISVYGVLADLRQVVVDRLAFLGTLGEPLPRLAAANLRASTDLLNAIDSMRQALSEDELIYLAYRRHVECHPFQNSFRLRLSKGQLVENTHVLGKIIATDVAQAAIQRVLRQHGVAEPKIAVDFAERLLPLLQRVGTTADKFVAH